MPWALSISPIIIMPSCMLCMCCCISALRFSGFLVALISFIYCCIVCMWLCIFSIC